MLWVSDVTYVASWKGPRHGLSDQWRCHGSIYVAFVIDGMRARSSAGASAPPLMPGSFWMPANRRCMNAARPRAWGSFTTATSAANICRSNTLNGWRMPASNLPWAASATALIEPWSAFGPRTIARALAETINGLLKAEVIRRRGPWCNFEAVEYGTLEWLDWFNNRRLLETNRNMPPTEAEAHFYAALETHGSVGNVNRPLENLARFIPP